MVDFQRLLNDARTGCEAARESLFGSYADYLTMVSRNSVRGQLRQKVDPEDLSQDALADAFRQFEQFRGNSEREFIGWLRRILSGQLAMLYRHYLTTESRDIRQEERIPETISLALANSVSSGSSPSNCAIRHEEADILAEAIAGLPKHYREVILLRHLDGRSFGEIADATSRSIDSVQKLWVRGLTKLRAALKERLG